MSEQDRRRASDDIPNSNQNRRQSSSLQQALGAAVVDYCAAGPMRSVTNWADIVSAQQFALADCPVANELLTEKKACW